MAKKSQNNNELRGLSKTELLKLAKSKKLKINPAAKKEEILGKLDAVKKLEKLKKLVQTKKRIAGKLPKGVPLPLPAKSKKKKPAKRKPLRMALPAAKIRRKKTFEIPASTQNRIPLHTGKEEEEIEEKKYFVSPSGEPRPAEPVEELPHGYGVNRIVLLARDPEWLFSYWEVTPDRVEAARRFFESEWGTTRSILRVYDVSNIKFNGSNAHSHFDIELSGNARNWYIRVSKPDCSFIVEIGIVSKSGKYFMLARSNAARTPRSRMSDVIDEEWMSIDFDRIYALSGGLRVGASSAQMRRLIEQGLPLGISSGYVSSPVKIKGRNFWFVLDAELIVYGATEPGAQVKVQGKRVKLRPDGTFSLRYAFTDGVEQITAAAQSADGIEERAITLDVSRKTVEKSPKLKEGLRA